MALKNCKCHLAGNPCFREAIIGEWRMMLDNRFFILVFEALCVKYVSS